MRQCSGRAGARRRNRLARHAEAGRDHQAPPLRARRRVGYRVVDPELDVVRVYRREAEKRFGAAARAFHRGR